MDSRLIFLPHCSEPCRDAVNIAIGNWNDPFPRVGGRIGKSVRQHRDAGGRKPSGDRTELDARTGKAAKL